MAKKIIDSAEQIKSKLALHFSSILSLLNLDLKDPNLADTPRRVADMYYNELCVGLHTEPPKCTVFPSKGIGKHQMVVIKDIETVSLCSHHWMPFIGKTHIGYIPGKSLMGLSKGNRIVNYFAARPQLQENLTDQIGEHLKDVLQTEDVMVVMSAKHMCMSIRGAKDHSSSAITSFVSGKFFDEDIVRAEFFKLLNLPL